MTFRLLCGIQNTDVTSIFVSWQFVAFTLNKFREFKSYSIFFMEQAAATESLVSV